ncbi:MAG: hypothetical protein AB1489_06680 [Acidobacteriota bacterium]
MGSNINGLGNKDWDISDSLTETKTATNTKLISLGTAKETDERPSALSPGSSTYIIAGNPKDAIMETANEIINRGRQTAGELIDKANELLDKVKKTIENRINDLGTLDPNGKLPGAIKRDDLSTTDKAVLNILQLDKLKPGEKVTLTAKEAASLGIDVAKLGVSENGTITVERGMGADSNKIKITVEAGGSASAGPAASANDQGAGANLSIEGKVRITMEVDLSKPGEATKLGKAILGGNVRDMITMAMISANPSDKETDFTEFVNEHTISVEVEGSINVEAEAKIAQLTGLDPKIIANISGGGKVEFDKGANRDDPNDDTTKVTVSVSTSAKISGSKDEEKVPGVKIKGPGGELEAKVSLENTTILDKNKMPIGNESVIKLTVSGNILVPNQNGVVTTAQGVNGELELSVSVNQLMKKLPPEVAKKLQDAIKRGDMKEVSRIIQENVVNNPSITLNAKLSVNASTKIGVEIGKEIAGTGGSIGLEAESQIPIIAAEGTATINKDGVTITGKVTDGTNSINGNVTVDGKSITVEGNGHLEIGTMQLDGNGKVEISQDGTKTTGGGAVKVGDNKIESETSSDASTTINDLVEASKIGILLA